MVMDMEREANAIAEAIKGLFGLVRGELAAAHGELAALKGELVAVREELAQQKERVLMLERGNLAAESEMDELRRELGIVGERSLATAAVVEERERELAAVKGELIGVKGELIGVKGELTGAKGELLRVKGELAEHKDAMAEQLDLIERRRESDLRQLHEKGRKRKAVSADVSAPGSVAIPSPLAPLSEADKAFKKQLFRPWINASSVHDAWGMWNTRFGEAGLTLRDELAAGGFSKKYELVKAEDSAMTRQKRLMAAVSEYAAARSGGLEQVIQTLDDIGARIGFTSFRDGLIVRSAKACPETFANLRMSKPACEKAMVALELVRAGLEDEAWGQKQYPNSWSSWVKEYEGLRKRPRES